MGRIDAARVTTLGECAEVLPGFSVRGRMEHDPDGTHQVILTRHLEQGLPYTYKEQDEHRLAIERDTSKYEIVSGDVLFMSRGARNLAWAIASVPRPTVAPVSFYILKPKDGVSPAYLAWYLNQAPAQRAIDEIRTGAATPIVQRKAFRDLPVVLPSPETQLAIADLAELFATERALHTKLADLMTKRQSLIGNDIIERLGARVPRVRSSNG